MNIKYLEIKFINVKKRYNKIWIFNGYNGLLDNSKINFLVAQNGVGKSTLIKMILNIINYKGLIETNIKTKSYVPEKINLPDYISVENFFKLISLNEDKKEELILKFKINKKKMIKELSKGMKQKILLIQAISKDVEGYFFDEPLNGLDDRSIEIFINEIFKLYKNNKFILIATHQIKRFENLPINIIRLFSDEEV